MIPIDKIIAYENGELSFSDTLKLFSTLIATGQCWTLQGHYGRAAQWFINRGLIATDGVVDWDYAALCDTEQEA